MTPDLSPAQQATRATFQKSSTAVVKIDQAVRVNGIQKLPDYWPDGETRAQIAGFKHMRASNTSLDVIRSSSNDRLEIRTMDRISGLPDDILTHILSFLPTKQSVSTMLLSSRWLNVWASVPVLDFDNDSYVKHIDTIAYETEEEKHDLIFVNFVNKVLSRNHSTKIRKFRLCSRYPKKQSFGRVNIWLETVMKRNVVELELYVYGGFFPKADELLQIPASNTLEILKISCTFGAMNVPWYRGCFPNLRILEAEFPYKPPATNSVACNIFPPLPLLERICFYALACEGVMEFAGSGLKSIDLQLNTAKRDEGCDPTVVIHAPQLEYLLVKDGYLASYPEINIPPTCKVKLDVGIHVFSDRGEIIYIDEDVPLYEYRSMNLLQKVSHVKTLAVTAKTMRAIHAVYDDNLPMFLTLTRLELSL